MEAAIANVTRPGARALVVVTGYFGDRLAQILRALRRRRFRAWTSSGAAPAIRLRSPAR